MENRIARMPSYTINSEIIHREQVSFGDNVKEKLEWFASQHLPETRLRIGYNAFEMKVFSKSLTEWTEEKHKAFCWNFNAILYKIERIEQRTANEWDFDVIYIYVRKFVKQKDNEELTLGWDYVEAWMYEH